MNEIKLIAAAPVFLSSLANWSFIHWSQLQYSVIHSKLAGLIHKPAFIIHSAALFLVSFSCRLSLFIAASDFQLINQKQISQYQTTITQNTINDGLLLIWWN